MKDRAREDEAELERKLDRVRERKERLVQAHVYDRTIDAALFRGQMDKLRNEETLLSLDRYDAELEGLDVEATLEFAARTLSNVRTSWKLANTGRKSRLAHSIFPEGVTYDGEVVRTQVTARYFEWITPSGEGVSRLVTPARFELALPA